MKQDIENLTTDEIESLINTCKELVSALPRRRPDGSPDLLLGHEKALEILEWLISKKFLE